jgi:hypothetical protein
MCLSSFSSTALPVSIHDGRPSLAEESGSRRQRDCTLDALPPLELTERKAGAPEVE